MKNISFYAKTNRSDNVLHIETDGAIVNVYVGLHDEDGHDVTTVEVLPDDASRGGEWKFPPDQLQSRIRVVRDA